MHVIDGTLDVLHFSLFQQSNDTHRRIKILTDSNNNNINVIQGEEQKVTFHRWTSITKLSQILSLMATTLAYNISANDFMPQQ